MKITKKLRTSKVYCTFVSYFIKHSFIKKGSVVSVTSFIIICITIFYSFHISPLKKKDDSLSLQLFEKKKKSKK